MNFEGKLDRDRDRDGEFQTPSSMHGLRTTEWSLRPTSGKHNNSNPNLNCMQLVVTAVDDAYIHEHEHERATNAARSQNDGKPHLNVLAAKCRARPVCPRSTLPT